MILHPEEHIGLIAVAIKKWSPIQPRERMQDSEEWSAAAEGLILGCRNYQANCRWKPSTWLCWQMRSKLRILQVARRRYDYKKMIAQKIHTQRAVAGVLDERLDEEKEWVASLVERLPWQERSVIRRGLRGQMRHRIAGDMGLDEYQVVKIRRRAYKMLWEMIEAES